jgi:hypothetical protein
VIEDIREIHDLSAEQPERLKSIIAEYRAAVRKTPSFAPFDTKSDRFTKAGSKQTSEKLRGKGVLCRAKLTAGRLIRTTVRKRHFFRHLYIKCIILPRQARDKHRENSKEVPLSRRLPGVDDPGAGASAR